MRFFFITQSMMPHTRIAWTCTWKSVDCYERDPTVCDDWTTFATSSTKYLASRVVFTAVVADACMVERVLSIDVAGAAMASAMPAHARAYARPAGPRCAFERPSASVVEGRGGIMWYESM